MKKSMQLIGLMSLIINSAFSQDRIMHPYFSSWTYSVQIDSNLLKKIDYNVLRDSFPKTNHYIQKREYYVKGTVDENMKILKPMGIYPSLITKPDTTIRYTLLIKKP